MECMRRERDTLTYNVPTYLHVHREGLAVQFATHKKCHIPSIAWKTPLNNNQYMFFSSEYLPDQTSFNAEIE